MRLAVVVVGSVHILHTVTCQINVHNIANSIDFNVFSRLQEKL